jgi:hypothetical protein
MAQVGVSIVNCQGFYENETLENLCCRTLVDSKRVDVSEFLKNKDQDWDLPRMLNINEPNGAKNIQPAEGRQGISDCPKHQGIIL